MIRWALLLLLAGCVHTPSHDELRATTLRLRFQNSICSGTAVAPDMILTAKHCWHDVPLTVNGKAVTVQAIHAGKGDRLLIQLTKPIFTAIAKLGKAPKQGERIRFWGNPHGTPDVYREGYVTTIIKGEVVISAYACGGDSGSGLFSDAGQVVGILTRLNVNAQKAECRFTFGEPNL